MKKKMIYKFIIMMMFTLTVFNLQLVSFASGGLMDAMFGITTQPSISGDGSAEINTMVSSVLGFISKIGIAIGVGMIMYVGIRYTMASANEKADLKDSSIRLLVGALIVTGASGLFPLFWNLAATLGVS